MIAMLKLATGFWRELLIAGLLVACLIQTNRLTSAQGEVAVFQEREAAQKRQQAFRELQAVKNKERTDAQYEADLRRARSQRVRDPGTPIITDPPAFALGGDEPAVSFDRGLLERELAGWAQRAARGLGEVVSRNAERLGGDAQSGEEVAAAYRALQAYLLSMDGAAK